MTESQVRKAAEAILGEELYHALESTRYPLPQILNQAAMKCFLYPPVESSEVRHARYVRQALLNLETQGSFQFDKE